jgi:hypothetical protein
MAMFVHDTFTGSGGTEITTRSGETGATWTALSAPDRNGNPQLYSNRATRQGGLGTSKASGTPATADYEVMVFAVFDGHYAAWEGVSAYARVSNSDGDYYRARLMEGSPNCVLYLRKRTGGGSESDIAGPWNLSTPTAGTAVKLTLRVTGSNPTVVKAYIDDVERLSYTDSTSPVTATGVAGFGVSGVTALNDGFSVDKVEAWDVASTSISLAQIERNSITRGLNRGVS